MTNKDIKIGQTVKIIGNCGEGWMGTIAQKANYDVYVIIKSPLRPEDVGKAFHSQVSLLRLVTENCPEYFNELQNK